MIILGIHCGHDSAAALLIDGEIVGAASEERFSRVKNDSSFPVSAISFLLGLAGINSSEIDVIAFPQMQCPPDFSLYFTGSFSCGTSLDLRSRVKKLIRNQIGRYPSGPENMPIYSEKFNLSPRIRLAMFGHHQCHAASAYYSSQVFRDDPGKKLLAVTIDGFGGGDSMTVSVGQNGELRQKCRAGGSGSIGWFYGNVTESLGWRHGSDEWKVMGLAPYGDPHAVKPLEKFCPKYDQGNLVSPINYSPHSVLPDHGSLHWASIDSVKIKEICHGYEAHDVAATTQRIVEDQMMNIIRPWVEKTGLKDLVCAGGSFLNIKFNQKLWEQDILNTQWIFPESGDAGLALGACFSALNKYSPKDINTIAFNNAYLGKEYPTDTIRQILDERGLRYRKLENPLDYVADKLKENMVVGWFHGRFEYGPRALGARSILMSPAHKKNKDIINAKIKFRESFRPFCPSILDEYSSEYMRNFREELYMTTSFKATEIAKDRIPAVVHVDDTLRPQIVKRHQNETYHELIKTFAAKTGIGALMNTSFNVKGEPVVNTPIDAIKCFYSTGIDVLYLQGLILEK